MKVEKLRFSGLRLRHSRSASGGNQEFQVDMERNFLSSTGIIPSPYIDFHEHNRSIGLPRPA